ncbi:Receptor-like protein kinase FERONIA [Vitis vinifera]|uniref:Receptor-like protein kinase FERONIA n=1 Tax=Vitis vinifera TaxID=29760 RepID=A0A438CC34_VITVI|nr:Receptor-like protein kinase FERONIA [Vitis vinifera]
MGRNRVRNRNNLTWILPVDLGFMYLVRLHFCETNPKIVDVSDRQFTIYIDRQMVDNAFDVIALSKGNSIPVFKDYAVRLNLLEANNPEPPNTQPSLTVTKKSTNKKTKFIAIANQSLPEPKPRHCQRNFAFSFHWPRSKKPPITSMKVASSAREFGNVYKGNISDLDMP